MSAHRDSSFFDSDEVDQNPTIPDENEVQNKPDIYVIHEDTHEEIDDEIDRERRGDNIYDAEERLAEEQGEDLFFNDNELIAGHDDALREQNLFSHLGINVNKYDENYIDDNEEYSPMSAKRRRAIENLMDYRDYKTRQKSQFTNTQQQTPLKHSNHIMNGLLVDTSLHDLLDLDDEEERMKEIEQRVQRRRRFQDATISSDQPDVSSFESAQLALRVEPKENTLDDRLQKAVDVCFRYFLHTFSRSLIEEHSEDTFPFYLNKMNKMILDESALLHVSATHLFRFGCESLLRWIEDQPSPVLDVMNDTLAVEINQLNRELFTKVYKNLTFKVVLNDWPYTTTLRNLRCTDLNTLIRVTGVINKRGNILPKLKVLYLTCSTCRMTLNENPVYFDKAANARYPKNCINCGSSSFVVNRLKTVYSDIQRLTLQESPGNVPAGLSARQKELIITGEMVDKVKPGDEVDVLGVYKTKYDTGLNIRVGFPVLATEIEVNNIVRKEDVRIEELTDEDIVAIQELSRDPNIRERIIASIAPSIWGHRDLKIALTYAMFGGVRKGGNDTHKNLQGDLYKAIQSSKSTKSGVHTIRGDINVLLLGDPGLGKSQALQYVHKTFPRTVLTNGKGASAAGLTAGLKRDNQTGEWTLEGGALVLADEGICLIDEFDKMTEKDRVSIHEAMEQQTISISKANITTGLKARCAVIAAANPKHGGRYEPSYTFKENVDLSDPILSRFDLIIVMRDVPNVDHDYYLAQYVVTNHQLSHPDILHTNNSEQRVIELEDKLNSTQAYQPIEQDLLKKYIIYARSRCVPTLEGVLNEGTVSKLSAFYSKLRIRASSVGGYVLTLRHMESILRIAEANCKMRLCMKVEERDIDFAIATLLDSFITTQKYAVANTLSTEFARYRTLARGGTDMLIHILRSTLQNFTQTQHIKQTLHNKHAQQLTHKQSHTHHENEQTQEENQHTNTHTNIPNQQSNYLPLHRTQQKIPLQAFIQKALKSKFTRYQIDNWLLTDSFKSLYYIQSDDGTTYIHCKSLYPESK